MLLISRSHAEKHRNDAVNNHFSDFSRSIPIDFSSLSVIEHSSKLASNGAMKGMRTDSDFSTTSEKFLPMTVYFT